ncbi:MAG: TAXI family TRAP transporter solute-binding subunit [Phormidium sp.]
MQRNLGSKFISANNLIYLGLGCLSIGLIGAFGWFFLESNFKTHRLTLVAGSKDGESYILSKALERVVEAKNPQIQIDVVETKGTEENIQKLEKGEAQLATAQADIPAGRSARVVVFLYPDTFQLAVKANSDIKDFADLKGKRIALWQRGGQYHSFLQIANHYGMEEKDFIFVGNNSKESDRAFRQNQADALFRVRGLGNKNILDLVQQYNGRLLPLDQGAALRIKYPAFESAEIPKGAYRGSNPAIPEVNLPTIAVRRLLLASEKVDSEVVRQITEILDSHRQEIADNIPNEFADVRPLVASITRPTTTGGTGIPIHAGSLAYFERDQPSFIQENADYLALILTVTLLVGSWFWEVKGWLERRRKNESDRHISTIIGLMKSVQEKQIPAKVGLEELDKVFAQAATDLIDEKISQESFRTLSEAYKATRDVIAHQIDVPNEKSDRIPKIPA